MEIRDYNGHMRHVDEEFDGDGDLRIQGGYFSRAEVTKLRDHLSVVLGDVPKAEAKPALAIGLGREYGLLPGARCSSGDRGGDACFWDVTRVRVEHGPDSDGDYRVRLLDGPEANQVAHTPPAFLAPLDETPAAPPAPDAVTAAREVADWYGMAGTDICDAISEAFRKFADKLSSGKDA